MSPHDVYRCDGADQWVAIAVRGDADWRARRHDGDDAIVGAATQTAVDCRTGPAAAGVPAHAVMNAALVRDDAHLAHREHFVQTRHAQLGDVSVESVGCRFSGLRARVGAVPSLDGDSAWVMREILGRG